MPGRDDGGAVHVVGELVRLLVDDHRSHGTIVSVTQGNAASFKMGGVCTTMNKECNLQDIVGYSAAQLSAT